MRLAPVPVPLSVRQLLGVFGTQLNVLVDAATNAEFYQSSRTGDASKEGQGARAARLLRADGGTRDRASNDR